MYARARTYTRIFSFQSRFLACKHVTLRISRAAWADGDLAPIGETLFDSKGWLWSLFRNTRTSHRNTHTSHAHILHAHTWHATGGGRGRCPHVAARCSVLQVCCKCVASVLLLAANQPFQSESCPLSRITASGHGRGSCHATMCCSVLQCVAVCCSLLQHVAVCCSLLQHVAVCCSVLQCVAVCCSVLQRVGRKRGSCPYFGGEWVRLCMNKHTHKCAAVCCSLMGAGAEIVPILAGNEYRYIRTHTNMHTYSHHRTARGRCPCYACGDALWDNVCTAPDVCCNVLQCDAVCCSAGTCCETMCSGLLTCIAMCCSVMQCVAVQGRVVRQCVHGSSRVL